jgi:methionine-gamma-lyase
MLALCLDGDAETHNRFVANLRVITSAVSLGHDESLIVYVGTTGPRVTQYPEPMRRLGHLRLSIGIEDPDDLLADLSAALDATFR